MEFLLNVFMGGTTVCHCECMMAKEQLCESSPHVIHGLLGNLTQVFKLGIKYLYPVNHFAGPYLFLNLALELSSQ